MQPPLPPRARPVAAQVMFSAAGLFANVPCPEQDNCKQSRCIFSHAPNAKQPLIPDIPIFTPAAAPSASSSSKLPPMKSSPTRNGLKEPSGAVVPAKRQSAIAQNSYANNLSVNLKAGPSEPPRKIQKLSDATVKPAASSVKAHSVSMDVI